MHEGENKRRSGISTFMDASYSVFNVDILLFFLKMDCTICYMLYSSLIIFYINRLII